MPLNGLGLWSVGINASLAVVKLATGVVGNSYALIADGIESIGDVVTSVLTWFGFYFSLKPADENHPYGHGKIESLAGVFSGISLLIAGGIIAFQAVQEILTPHQTPAWYTLPVLIGVVVIKELLSRKIFKAGHELGSLALQGDAWHHRSDAITSAVTAVGISISLWGGVGFEMADDWAALVACVVIVINAGIILKKALHEMLDGAPGAETAAQIMAVALGVGQVITVEKIRVRKSGIGILADLHVRVLGTLSVREGHQIGHCVKDKILASDKRIQDVLVHIEPAD